MNIINCKSFFGGNRLKLIFSLLFNSLIAITLTTAVNAKTLNMAYDADPVSLDPHEQLSGGTLQLSHMIFDPLLRWNRDLGFDARLAEKWERVDEKTVRFHLRKGVKFHSGNEMTALDVRWTFDRLKRSPDFRAYSFPLNLLTSSTNTLLNLSQRSPIRWFCTQQHTSLRWTASSMMDMTVKAAPRTPL